MVFSLYAKGLTDGETGARFREIHGASVLGETVGGTADGAIEEMSEWSSRPLGPVHAAVSVECDRGTARSSAARSARPSAWIRTDALGLWGSPASEGARRWLSMPTYLRSRGVVDALVPVCDGLRGLPDAVETVRPPATRADVRDPLVAQHVQARVREGPGRASP